jgi:hypothetical protein
MLRSKLSRNSNLPHGRNDSHSGLMPHLCIFALSLFHATETWYPDASVREKRT